jgi:hypothetical protein
VTYWKVDKEYLTADEYDRVFQDTRDALLKQAELANHGPKRDTEWKLHGINGRHLSFSAPSKLGEGQVLEEYWFGLHKGRGYILRAKHDNRLASPEDVERFFTSFQPLDSPEF